MAWRCRFLTARRTQRGAPNALVNFHTGEDHHVVVAKITDASVREDYWDGKTFRAPHGRAPFLSFLGSQSFGHTVQS